MLWCRAGAPDLAVGSTGIRRVNGLLPPGTSLLPQAPPQIRGRACRRPRHPAAVKGAAAGRRRGSPAESVARKPGSRVRRRQTRLIVVRMTAQVPRVTVTRLICRMPDQTNRALHSSPREWWITGMPRQLHRREQGPWCLASWRLAEERLRVQLGVSGWRDSQEDGRVDARPRLRRGHDDPASSTVTSTTIDGVRPRARPSSTSGCERQLRDHPDLAVVDAGLDGVVKGHRPT